MTEPEQTAMRHDKSLGEHLYGAEHCDLDGRPHLGSCVESGTRTADTFTDEWPDQPYSVEHAVADLEMLRAGGPIVDRAMRDAGFLPAVPVAAADLQPGDPLRVVLASGEEHHLVVTDARKVSADGTVTFGVADPERVAAMNRLAAHSAALEPHHARGKERTDEEQAVLEPQYATGGAIPAEVADEMLARLQDRVCAYDNGGDLPPALAWYRNDTGHAIQLDPTKPLPAGVVRLSEDTTPPKLRTGGIVRSGPVVVGDLPSEVAR